MASYSWRPSWSEDRFGRSSRLRPVSYTYSAIAFAWIVTVDIDEQQPEIDGHIAVARDIEDVHRWTAAVLQEIGVATPTVVVVQVPKSLADSWFNLVRANLQRNETAAATWLVREGQAEATVADLLDPQVVHVDFVLRHERDFQADLQSWITSPALMVLEPFLSAIMNMPTWRSHQAGTGVPLEEYRQQTDETLRKAFERFLKQDDLSGRTSPSAVPDAATPPGALRLKKVELHNIGGLDDITIELAQHVTIVLAGNGVGKSSITNGLLMALTGASWWPDDRLARKGSGQAHVVVERKGGDRQRWCLAPPDDGAPPAPWWRNQALFTNTVMRDVTALADQHVEAAILKGDGSPILQTLRPRTPREDALWALIESVAPIISKAGLLIVEERALLAAEEATAAQLGNRAKTLTDLRDKLLTKVKEPLKNLGQPEGLVSLFAQLTAIEQQDATLLGAKLPQTLLDKLKDLNVVQKGTLVVNERPLAQVEDELDAAKWAVVQHKATLTWIGDDAHNLPRLLNELLGRVSRWKSAPATVPDAIAAPIVAVFSAVEPDALSALVQHVERAAGQAQAALANVDSLERQVEALRSRLFDDTARAALQQAAQSLDDWIREERTSWNSAVEELKQAQGAVDRALARAKALEHLIAVEKALASLQENLKPTQDPTKAIEEAINGVVRRFGTIGATPPSRPSVADGSSTAPREPIQVSLDSNSTLVYKVCLDNDTRPLATLSTGQKHQFALAKLIAERQLIQVSGAGEYLGHRCLILDDAASSHDDDASAREALILRQLAYHPDDKIQVQLVLLTHHRQLAERYAQLLAPPEGFELTYVRLHNKHASSQKIHPSRALGNELPDTTINAMRRTLTFGRPLSEHNDDASAFL